MVTNPRDRKGAKMQKTQGRNCEPTSVGQELIMPSTSSTCTGQVSSFPSICYPIQPNFCQATEATGFIFGCLKSISSPFPDFSAFMFKKVNLQLLSLREMKGKYMQAMCPIDHSEMNLLLEINGTHTCFAWAGTCAKTAKGFANEKFYFVVCMIFLYRT